MAKAKQSPKPLEVSTDPVLPSAVEDKPPAPPEPPVVLEKPLVFRANWKLDGLPSGNLEVGDTVELEEETAAPLVECGVLSAIEDQ